MTTITRTAAAAAANTNAAHFFSLRGFIFRDEAAFIFPVDAEQSRIYGMNTVFSNSGRSEQTVLSCRKNNIRRNNSFSNGNKNLRVQGH